MGFLLESPVDNRDMEPPQQPGDEHHSGMALIALVAAGATAAALIYNKVSGDSDAAPAPHLTCNTGQELVAVDHPTWSSVAEQLSTDWPWYISAARLRQANAGLIQGKPGTKNHLTSTLNPLNDSGEVCYTLPGPVVAGFEEENGERTVKQIAKDSLESIKVLVKKNPGLKPSPDYVPPAGTLVNISYSKNPVNTHFFERVSEFRNLNLLPDETPEQRTKLLAANAAAAALGKIHKGDLLMLPPYQTEYMKKHGITVAALHNMYDSNYTHPNVDQNSLPNNPNSDITPANYSLNKKQLELIDSNPNLQHYKKQFVKTLLPIIESRVKGGDRMNGAAFMYIAINESDWGTSQIARGGFNAFGVKADSSWNGQVMDANGSEQNPDGSYTSSNMLWRKYNSWGDAVDDYALFIGDGTHPWFTDELYCDQTARQTLMALEYKLNKKTCQPVGYQPYPGYLEPAHATSHNYVHDVLAIRQAINIEAILAAGKPVKTPHL